MDPELFFITVALNLPKFFEFRGVTKNNFTFYTTTSLNEHQTYITFSSWWDELIVTGMIPFVLLLVLNSRIYLKVRKSSMLSYKFVSSKSYSSNKNNENKNRLSAISPRSHSQFVTVEGENTSQIIVRNTLQVRYVV